MPSIHHLFILLAAWDPLEWVHDMQWYQDMLNAEWFRSIRPYWIKYHLDWAVAVLLLTLIFFLFYGLVRRRRTRATFKEARTEPLREARDYLKAGERMLAAESYLRAGKLGRAFDIFVEEHAWFKAAQVAEQMGHVDQAAGLYEQAKALTNAIRVLRRAGKLDAAEALFRQQDQLAEAAGMFQEEGEPRKAAALYEEVGLYVKAAWILYNEGENLAAAGCLLKLAAESTSGFTHEENELLLEGARTFKDAKRYPEAARLFLATQRPEEAGELYLKAGQAGEAAACFEKAGHWQRAANLYRELDRPKERHRALRRLRDDGGVVDPHEWAEVLTAAGCEQEAAEAYRKLGDVSTAVEILGDSRPHEAASLLAEKGHHRQAAAKFMDAGDPIAAREQYLIIGDLAGAASAATQAGMHFEAGQDFFAVQEMTRAVDALQRVSSDHPSYREAASLLARAFTHLDDRVMAGKMHQRATEGVELTTNSLQTFYHWARFLEDSEDESERIRAESIYADILTVQYTFEDAKKRLDEMRASRKRGSVDTERLGPYLLLQRIGSGGMAEVFKAKHKDVVDYDHFVAIKRIRSEFARDDEFIDMLMDEARIAAMLDHTHIAQILDFGKVDGRAFIAMEFVNGKNLRSVWRREKDLGSILPLAMSVFVGASVCEGLAHAHDQKSEDGQRLDIVHRDMSPENVMVGFDGAIKIIDFGIAKAANRYSETRTGILKGKFAYMSPEQVRGLPIDQRSDIFSCGIVLFEMVTGRHLFRTGDDAAVLELVRNAVVPDPTLYNPHVPGDLRDVLFRALAKDPDDRFQRARELQVALLQVLNTHTEGCSRQQVSDYMKRTFQDEFAAADTNQTFQASRTDRVPTKRGSAE